MKILFLASWFPSRIHPTHGNFVAKHARLVATTHEVVVVNIQDDPNLKPGAMELVETLVDDYVLIQVYFGQLPATAQWRKIYYRYFAYEKARKYLKTKWVKPDLVHANILLDAGMVGAYWADKWGVPLVITEQCTAYLEPGALTGLRYYLGRLSCRRAVAILPVSSQLAEGMRNVNQLSGNYLPFSNVVDTELFSYVPVSQSIPFQFLHVSSFKEAHKNVQGIINAFAQVYGQYGKEVQLLLAGDGDHDAVQQRIAASGLPQGAVLLSGPHDEKEIARLMQQSHAFVLFSNYETQGVVLLESMACGRPVIGTKVAGILDVVREDFLGQMIDAGDESALATAMVSMMETYDNYDPLRIRDYALDRYSEPSILKLLNGYYQNAV